MGPLVEQVVASPPNVEPQPRPVDSYVVPGRYGTKTCAGMGLASKPHWPPDSSPWVAMHTVIEFGLIASPHGKGASVAVTMSASDTDTSCGADRV